MILTDADVAILSMLSTGYLKCEPAAYAAWAARGVRDVDVIHQYDDTLGFDLNAAPTPLTVNMLEGAAIVGFKPYVDAPDLADRWAQIGRRIREADEYVDVPGTVATWLDAGKDPAALDALVMLLIEHDRIEDVTEHGPEAKIDEVRALLDAALPPGVLAQYHRLRLNTEAALAHYGRGHLPSVGALREPGLLRGGRPGCDD